MIIHSMDELWQSSKFTDSTTAGLIACHDLGGAEMGRGGGRADPLKHYRGEIFFLDMGWLPVKKEERRSKLDPLKGKRSF